jgi:hypothetical protein
MGIATQAIGAMKGLLSGDIPPSELPLLVKRGAAAIYRALRSRYAGLALAIHRRWSLVAVNRSKTESNPGACIAPSRTSYVYFRNVPRGDFALQIAHADRLIATSRKSLVAHFDLADGDTRTLLQKSGALSRSPKRRAFSYMGGGRWRDGQWHQAVELTVPRAQRWVRVALNSPLWRSINVDSVTLIVPRLSLPVEDIRDAVAAWIEAHPQAREVRYVLYANIDLNVVDGSSVWLLWLPPVMQEVFDPIGV